MSNINKILLAPLFLILIFNTLTVTLYYLAYEKMNSNDNNDILMLIFLLITFLFFIIGYIPKKNINISNNSITKKMSSSFFLMSIIIAMYSFLHTLLIYYGSPIELIRAVSNPFGNYEYVKRSYRELSNNDVNSYIGILNTILSSFKSLYIIYGIYYWNQVNKKLKVLFLVTLLFNLIYILLIGAMINLAYLFILILPIFILKFYRRGVSENLKTLIITSVVLVGLMYLLGSRQVFSSGTSFLDTISGGFIGLVFYISHGYEGLSKSLSMNFNPTFGEGAFRGIAPYFVDTLNFNSRWESSLLAQNEIINGWPALQLWSTAFAWLASDFSFYSIPIIFFLLGVVLRNTWIGFIKNQSFIELLFLSNLFLFFFMIPANNQVFHTFSNSIYTIVITLLYILNKMKRRGEK